MMHAIGVAGCGWMGMDMLRNLQQAGFATRGYDMKLLRLLQTASGQNWFASGFDQIECARARLCH